MDNILSALGILGAYFAILLVLAVSVEIILDPITIFKPLRKKISPNDFLNDVNEWLPADTQEKTNAIAAVSFAKDFKTELEVVETRLKEVTEVINKTSDVLGIGDELTELQREITIWYTLLYEYKLSEQQRIVILRLLSALIGIVLAFLFQLDTFILLTDLLPQQANELLSSQIGHYGGMIITGLAASAGSSFWHDQLGKVRAVKEASQQIQGIMNK